LLAFIIFFIFIKHIKAESTCLEGDKIFILWFRCIIYTKTSQMLWGGIFCLVSTILVPHQIGIKEPT
jgi:hypothetical protein